MSGAAAVLDGDVGVRLEDRGGGGISGDSPPPTFTGERACLCLAPASLDFFVCQHNARRHWRHSAHSHVTSHLAAVQAAVR